MERLIRQAGEQGIALSGIRRTGSRKISGLVPEDDLPALAELAQNGGWRFEAGGRRGAGRWLDTLKRRWLLAAGCLIAAACLLAASRLVWRIEIVDAGIYEADLRAFLPALDVRPLRWKKDIDLGALRDSLEWRYPEVAWMECGYRGMTLTITVVEGVASGDALTHLGSGDVVAARDGVVERIITLTGTPQVQPGQTVRAGQVLIRGEERTSDGLVRPVSARGKVMARVWDGASVRMSIWERATVYSGRQQRTAVVSCPWFDLWRTESSGFEQQDVAVRVMPLGGLFLPFTLRFETRMEADVSLKARDMEQLRTEAALAAMRKLREKVGMDDVFLTKWVDYSMIDDENLLAVAIGERVLDIAESSPRGQPAASRQ